MSSLFDLPFEHPEPEPSRPAHIVTIRGLGYKYELTRA